MAKIQRNQLCSCNSKLKYKDCCLFVRHGGERIKEKSYTSYDLRKKLMERLIDAHHVDMMNEIIRKSMRVKNVNQITGEKNE